MPTKKRAQDSDRDGDDFFNIHYAGTRARYLILCIGSAGNREIVIWDSRSRRSSILEKFALLSCCSRLSADENLLYSYEFDSEATSMWTNTGLASQSRPTRHEACSGRLARLAIGPPKPRARAHHVQADGSEFVNNQ